MFLRSKFIDQHSVSEIRVKTKDNKNMIKISENSNS